MLCFVQMWLDSKKWRNNKMDEQWYETVARQEEWEEEQEALRWKMVQERVEKDRQYLIKYPVVRRDPLTVAGE